MNAVVDLIEKSKISPSRFFIIGLASIAALVVSARIQVPLYPVPITFQTVVVLTLPFLLGYRAAMVCLASYFALGAMGIPVFANGSAGLAYFFGPTGGYLAGFIAAVSVIGFSLSHRKNWNLAALFLLMIAGHALILASGFIWLAYGAPSLGAGKALAAGVIPFLGGSVLKSAIAGAFIKAVSRKS